MSCCSRSRPSPRATQFRAATAQPRAVPARPADAEMLAYAGAVPLALRGPTSGRIYRVAQKGDAIDAEPGDITALVRTGLFTPLPA